MEILVKEDDIVDGQMTSMEELDPYQLITEVKEERNSVGVSTSVLDGDCEMVQEEERRGSKGSRRGL